MKPKAAAVCGGTPQTKSREKEVQETPSAKATPSTSTPDAKRGKTAVPSPKTLFKSEPESRVDKTEIIQEGPKPQLEMQNPDPDTSSVKSEPTSSTLLNPDSMETLPRSGTVVSQWW